MKGLSRPPGRKPDFPAFRAPSSPSARGGFNPATQADYFVSTTGSDANDGLSPETPKLTIQAIPALFYADSGDKTVYVAPGTYKGGPEHPAGGAVLTERRKITYYMAGVTVDCEDDAAANFANNCRNYQEYLTVEVVGPCTMQNTANDNVNFGGTYSAGAEATMIIRDVSCLTPAGGNLGDCFSAHGNSIGYAYGCTFTVDGNKSAIAHIDASRTYHYDCTVNIVSASGSQVKVAATASGSPEAYFYDCVFKTQAASVVLLSVNDSGANSGYAYFERCQMLQDGGTWNVAGANGENSSVVCIDCYAEGWGTEPNAESIIRRCYGDWNLRVGRGGGLGNVLIENNVFKRASVDILIWGAYATGAFQGGPGGTIRNNIFMDTTNAAIRSVTTAGAIDAVNSLWSFENNLFFDNAANYTAGITPDGTDVTGQDPLLVTGAGSDQNNWKVQSGSPAIGAGTGGGNIGLGVAA